MICIFRIRHPKCCKKVITVYTATNRLAGSCGFFLSLMQSRLLAILPYSNLCENASVTSPVKPNARGSGLLQKIAIL